MARNRIVQLAFVGLVLACAGKVLADKMEKIHEGRIVSVTADTVVMTDGDGKNEHAHRVDSTVAVLIDGKPAKLLELAKGDNVKVAIGPDGNVIRIAATRTKK